MNYLKDFFTEEQFNRLLSYCNDEDLQYNEPDSPYSTKWDMNNLSDIKDKLDTMFIEYGYNTKHTNCRLQRTEPNAVYKTHKDFMGKRVSLIIYLVGKDGTTFYEDAVKQEDKTFKGSNPTVDTFTPNAGYWFDNHENGRYHSYQNTQDTPRWILMYNIMQMDGEKPVVTGDGVSFT